jgi:hypothetical protein
LGFQSIKTFANCSWSFKTDKNDIGFSVLLDGTEIVVPYKRLNSHEEVQCGGIKCAKPGKCKILLIIVNTHNVRCKLQLKSNHYSLGFADVLVFDNSFSRWRSKVVRYRVIVEEGKERNGETTRMLDLRMESLTICL